MNSFDVRDTLKEVIAERGYIQAAIAKKAHLTPAKLSAILNKTRKLDANEMFVLCAVLQIEPRELAKCTADNDSNATPRAAAL